MEPFSVEITLDSKGVRAVRIYGKSWQQCAAYALLERVGPLIEQLDRLAKGGTPSSEITTKEHVQ